MSIIFCILCHVPMIHNTHYCNKKQQHKKTK